MGTTQSADSALSVLITRWSPRKNATICPASTLGLLGPRAPWSATRVFVTHVSHPKVYQVQLRYPYPLFSLSDFDPSRSHARRLVVPSRLQLEVPELATAAAAVEPLLLHYREVSNIVAHLLLEVGALLLMSVEIWI